MHGGWLQSLLTLLVSETTEHCFFECRYRFFFQTRRHLHSLNCIILFSLSIRSILWIFRINNKNLKQEDSITMLNSVHKFITKAERFNLLSAESQTDKLDCFFVSVLYSLYPSSSCLYCVSILLSFQFCSTLNYLRQLSER